MKLFLVSLIGVLIIFLFTACDKPEPAALRAKNNLPNPNYVANANRGWRLFDSHCSTCHGPELTGTNKGPPLANKIYRSAHHADLTIYWAIQRGVKQHHWKFGNMPPQPQISSEQSADIVAYIRRVLREKGIE